MTASTVWAGTPQLSGSAALALTVASRGVRVIRTGGNLKRSSFHLKIKKVENQMKIKMGYNLKVENSMGKKILHLKMN